MSFIIYENVDLRTEKTFTLGAVGDIMLGRDVATFINRYGAYCLFEKVKGALQEVDILFGNSEQGRLDFDLLTHPCTRSELAKRTILQEVESKLRDPVARIWVMHSL